MNWKKIEKKYPKTFNLFFEWFKDGPWSSLMTKKEFLEINNIIIFGGDIRDLYDFFDAQKICIEITHEKKANLGWMFLGGITYNCDNEYWHSDWHSDYFKFRKGSEESTFEKAFEISENQLK